MILNFSSSSNLPRKILLLGSTGSIGSSTLDVIRQYPNNFELFALVANTNAEKMHAHLSEFHPRYAVMADSSACNNLIKLCNSGTQEIKTEIFSGQNEIRSLVAHPDVDIVVAAITGIAGLDSVLTALRAGKCVALANKESLVCAGALIKKILEENKSASLIPVDSEHSALFQLLKNQGREEVQSMTLTASGGPFYKISLPDLKNITPAQACKHPTWNMGAKISVDSATMVNKALEIIEAHWLFSIPVTALDVLLHPQSIIHALLRMKDGTQLAHLSVPDMKGAIAYALQYPNARLSNVMQELDLTKIAKLEFFPLDPKRFPAIDLAKKCVVSGGSDPAVFSLANEIAVSSFLSGALTFDKIECVIADTLDRFSGRSYESLEDLLELQREILNANISL